VQEMPDADKHGENGLPPTESRVQGHRRGALWVEDMAVRQEEEYRRARGVLEEHVDVKEA
jgi:hypothetical protein